MNYDLIYPLMYLRLQNERGEYIYRKNIISVIFFVIFITSPFVVFNANYFGDKGFLDRFGSFSAVLTGFYIAALVGVASFSSAIGDLDGRIEVGKIYRKGKIGNEREELTRREYVCSMFGYLSFISMILSMVAIFLLIISSPIKDCAFRWGVIVGDENISISIYLLRFLVILIFNVVLIHLLVTTCHGLYYLIDRLYARAPVLDDAPERDL